MPIMAKSNDEYTEVKAIKTPDGTEIDYVLSKVDNTYKRTYTATRELEDTPPLEFKSIKPNANLTNYRIYGQTSRNLFDENSLISPVSDFTWYFDDEHYLLATDATRDNRVWRYSQSQFHIALSAGTYTLRLSGVGASSKYSDIYVFKSNNDIIYSENITNKTNIVITFTLNTPETIGIEIKVYDGKYRIMLVEGSTALPYEPYGESVGDRTENLFDWTTMSEGQSGEWVDSYGTIHTETGWNITKQIAIPSNTVNLTMSAKLIGNVPALCFYNSTGDYIDGESYINRFTSYSSVAFSVPVNAAFIVFSWQNVNSSDLQNIMLNAGSTPLPYEQYGYKVPVTVEGKNLWSKPIEQGTVSGNGDEGNSTYRIRSTHIPVKPNTTYTFSSNLILRNIYGYWNDEKVGIISQSQIGRIITKEIPVNVNNVSIALKKEDDVDITPADFEWGQIEEGSEATTYEPYHAPVTTPIYLPEQIRKVGEYSDYIDYGSQKFVHRVVRKVFDGTEQFHVSLGANIIEYIVPVITMGDAGNSINCTSNHISAVSANYNWANRRVPNAQYVSSFFQNNESQIRFVWNDNDGVVNLAGLTSQLSTWFANNNPLIVDYIIVEPVEEQIALPALPTVTGTNVLSVGTEVQPSDMYIKGNFKMIAGGGE